MRIEQLRETGDVRPPLTDANFDGVTRASALRDLLIAHDFETERLKEKAAAEPIDTRVSRFVVNILLAAGMLGLILRGAVAYGQGRTIVIPHGTITTSTTPPTAAEAAAILKADDEDARRALLARASRWDGPSLVVAPCWSCDVERLRDARDALARSPWWSASGGRTFYRSNVDPWRTSRPFYGRFDRTVIVAPTSESRAKR